MERRTISLQSGVELSVLEGGAGRPLVMLPGWSQTAAEYDGQFAAFSKVARVIAVDQRGHGESASPAGDYRIQRLAKDLHELIVALDLDGPDLLGHSMGCSVIWSFMSLFQADVSVRKLVLVDQAPAVVARKGWSEEIRGNAGCLFENFDALADFEGAALGATEPSAHKEVIRGMFTASVDEARLNFLATENLKMPRREAVHLLHDHCIQDWRSAIAQIRRPTLVIGAEGSVFSAQSQRWIAAQIPGAEVEIFAADAGGSHFMFFENPERFNARVTAFLTA